MIIYQLCILAAWAKSGRAESIYQAESLLGDMESSNAVSPDLLSYSGVISCIAKSKKTTDAKKAEDILSRMTKISGVQPDNGT